MRSSQKIECEPRRNILARENGGKERHVYLLDKAVQSSVHSYASEFRASYPLSAWVCTALNPPAVRLQELFFCGSN